MASPVLRDDPAFFRLRTRIPADVLAKLKGRGVVIELPAVVSKPAITVSTKLAAEVKLSLRTADPTEAKVRMASATAALGAVVDGTGTDPCRSPTGSVWPSPASLSTGLRGALGSGAGQPRPMVGLQGVFPCDPRRPARRRPDRDDAKAIDAAVKGGRDLTAGVDALPRGAPDAAMKFRFGWLTDWTPMHRRKGQHRPGNPHPSGS